MFISPFWRTPVRLASLLGCLILAALSPVLSQDFRITSTSPADGATGVAIDATLQFDLNRDVALGNAWSNVLLYEPIPAVDPRVLTIGDITDGSTDVFFYEVGHQPDTDYTWIVVGLRSSGNRVIDPFVLRYTTAASWGTNTVEGTISATGLGKRAPLMGQGFALHERAPAPRIEAPVPIGATESEALRFATQQQAENTIVFLADRNVLDDVNWEMRAATLTVDASGAFSIPNVRDGVYWPVALKDLDDQGSPFEAVGFYDADGDTQPDSIVVQGGETLGGIDLSLFDFVPVTAQANAAEAQTRADAVASGHALHLVTALVDPSGLTFNWDYGFYAASQDLYTLISTQGYVFSTSTEEASDLIAAMRPMPDAYLDSDAVLARAQAAGGEDFLDTYGADNVNIRVRGGNHYWRAALPQDALFWEVTYIAPTESGRETLTLYFDLVTGEQLEPTMTSIDTLPEIPAQPFIAPPFPNPAQQSATLSVHQGASAPIMLAIYDVLGRRVATLHDGLLGPGTHDFAWQIGDAPAGLYLYQLTTQLATQSGTMVVH